MVWLWLGSIRFTIWLRLAGIMGSSYSIQWQAQEIQIEDVQNERL